MATQAMRFHPQASPHRLPACPALIAWSGLLAAACSGAAGVTGPSGEQLDTRISATRASVGDSIEVTARVTNPTGHRLTLVYGSLVTYAQVTDGDNTFGADVPLTGPDTIALAPGEQLDLRPVTLHLLRPGEGAVPVPSAASESLTLSPGAYEVSACAWVISDFTPEGRAWVPTCGQAVAFTVTP